MNTEREQAYWAKKLEMKKLYQVLIICDDLADVPQLHRPNGALDTLFIRGRRMQISTWVSIFLEHFPCNDPHPLL